MADKKKTTDIHILKARLEWAEKTLYAVLHGEKPAIDPKNPDQAWLYEQMSRMYKAGFLCEEPGSYVTLPGENPAYVNVYKGITSREPLPKQLTSEVKDLKEVTNDERRGVKNFKVFGADDAYRYRSDVLDQAEDADSFVLTRGGLMELYQWLHFVRAHMDGAIDLDEKIMVIQNADGFWNPVLRGLEGFQNISLFGNNFITDTRHDTAEVLETLLDDKRGDEPRKGDDREILTTGSTIFFVTGNRKKVNDYNKVFNRRGTDVRCEWFQQKFDKPLGADELSYSYIGNLVEKIENFYDHICGHYGPQGMRDAMAEKGFDVDKAVLWFDDSGLELAENLTSGPEFANASYRMNPYKHHGPAAEMKNAINAMQNHPFEGATGPRGFIKRLRAATERVKQERIDAGEDNPEVSNGAVDRCCVAIVPLKDLIDAAEQGLDFEQAMNSVPMHFLQAHTDHELIFEPRPDARAVDTKNFLVPVHDPDHRTQAENPHYVAQHSITAQVVKAAARVLGFEKYETGSHKLSHTFAREAGQAWRVGTQQSIHKDVNVHGLGKATMRKLKGLYELMPGNGGRFDLMRQEDHKLKHEDDSTSIMKSALNNFYAFTKRVDGFLLTPDTKAVSGDDYFWHRSFTFFSLIVGRQINDKAVTAKPLLVMDCPTWKPYIRLLETYGGGLIPEMPHEILDGIVKDKTEIVKKLDKAFSGYQPDEVPNYIFREDGDTCPDDLFCVTVYCSASTTDGPMKIWARDFSFDLAAKGFAIKNGGGTGPDGLMIETSEGGRIVKEEFDQFLQSQGRRAPKTHVSSIQCVDTAQEEGLCKFNDYWAVYPTIYQRMHELQNADAEVVLPGGAGTIQEIAASVLMRKAGIYPVKHRPLIIVNHEGIYDPLLKMIPKGDFKEFNIQIVNTADEAMDLLVKARQARNMEPPLPYNDKEFEKLKNAFIRHMTRQDAKTTLKGHTIG